MLQVMKETYLYFLWNQRYLPSTFLPLTDGRTIQIIRFGQFNATESGPDYTNGKFKLDEIYHSGCFEFHVKSSDWFKHGHQTDPAYKNVVLHIVWEMDTEVYIEGSPLPTIELKTLYTNKTLPSFYVGGKKKPACSVQWPMVNNHTVDLQKRSAILDKWNRKLKRHDWQLREDWMQVLYEMLAAAFGRRVNEVPFVLLAQRVPLLLAHPLSLYSKRALYQLQSNITFCAVEDNSQTALDPWLWRRKGLRPPSYPENRIPQFVTLVHHWPWDLSMESSLSLNVKVIFEDLKHFILDAKLSKDFITHLYLNVAMPFVYKMSHNSPSKQFVPVLFDSLKSHPAEKNGLIEFLKKCGIPIENAFDSQAFLELYTQFCQHSKCLECSIGREILSK